MRPLYLTLAQILPTLLIALSVELLAAARWAATRAEDVLDRFKVLESFGFTEPMSKEAQAEFLATAKRLTVNLERVLHASRRAIVLYVAIVGIFIFGELACVMNAAFSSSANMILGSVTLISTSLMCLGAVILPLATLKSARQ